MNISQMKNMIILKDLPSNIVDEAIVILKNDIKLKNDDFVVKEAEFIIEDYVQKIEKNEENNHKKKNINVKYKRLQISSIFFGITIIAGIIISIINC